MLPVNAFSQLAILRSYAERSVARWRAVDIAISSGFRRWCLDVGIGGGTFGGVGAVDYCPVAAGVATATRLRGSGFFFEGRWRHRGIAGGPISSTCCCWVNESAACGA